MADDFTARMRALAMKSPRNSVPKRKQAPKKKNDDGPDAQQVKLVLTAMAQRHETQMAMLKTQLTTLKVAAGDISSMVAEVESSPPKPEISSNAADADRKLMSQIEAKLKQKGDPNQSLREELAMLQAAVHGGHAPPTRPMLQETVSKPAVGEAESDTTGHEVAHNRGLVARLERLQREDPNRELKEQLVSFFSIVCLGAFQCVSGMFLVS